MSYLVRVILPDTPGSLGELAEAFGVVEANIQSVDIVETRRIDGNPMVTDDIVVELPTGAMVDSLITAAASLGGVEIDSIRPYSGRVDRREQIQMLARVATQVRDVPKAMDELVSVMPQALTSSWAVVLRATDDGMVRIAASQAAPGDDGSQPQIEDVTDARVLLPETDAWVPEKWWLLDSALAITPLKGTDLYMIVGRTGGPDFLASEVSHIGDLGTIVGELVR